MLALLKRKIDPEQARVEISDVIERIEVTAFPIMRSFYVGKKVDPALEKVNPEHRIRFLSDSRRELGYPVSEDELFVPNYARQEFHFDVGCSAFYLAEGTLVLPGLSDRTYGLKFGLPTHQSREHWWFLRLREKSNSYHGCSGKRVVKELLEGSGISVTGDVFQVAGMVAENIMLHILGPKDDDGQLLGRQRAQNLIEKGYGAARETYKGLMEKRLKQGISERLLPETFVYELVGNTEINPLNH